MNGITVVEVVIVSIGTLAFLAAALLPLLQAWADRAAEAHYDQRCSCTDPARPQTCPFLRPPPPASTDDRLGL